MIDLDPNGEPLGNSWSTFSQAGCPSCCSTNSETARLQEWLKLQWVAVTILSKSSLNCKITAMKPLLSVFTAIFQMDLG